MGVNFYNNVANGDTGSEMNAEGMFKDKPLAMEEIVDLQKENRGKEIGLTEKDNCGDCYGC